MNRRSCCALLLLSACVRAPPAVAPAPRVAGTTAAAERIVEPPCRLAPRGSIAEHIAEAGTVLDNYHLEGGVWLPHAPILVNEDFDFALAMAMEDGIGVGVAAAKRKANNQRKANRLAEVRLPPDVDERIAKLRCEGALVYFLLWGGDDPVLQLVLDVEADVNESRIVAGGSAEVLDESMRAVLREVGMNTGPARPGESFLTGE